jgi:hypothetical protein
MTIEVTQDDIDRGRSQSFTECPIAIACRRATGMTILISNEYAYIDAWHEQSHLPQAARWFVAGFDNGCRVHPFSFELDEAILETPKED